MVLVKTETLNIRNIHLKTDLPFGIQTGHGAGISARLVDIVQPFADEGDVAQCLNKLTHVSNRMKESMTDVMPLFREGPTYALYNKMP